MKKFYAMMALAVGASFAMDAATPMTRNSENLELQKNLNAFQGVSKERKSAPGTRAITSVEDLYGEYNTVYDQYAISSNDPGGSFSTIIEAGSTPTEVIMTGFPYASLNGYPYSLKANVDIAAGTLTLNAQDLYYSVEEGATVQLIMLDGLNNNTPISSVTATIEADGTISYPEYVAYCVGMDAGYYFAWWGMTMSPIKAFEFVASDWVAAGTANYKDPWILGAFGEDAIDEVPYMEVNIMKHKSIDGEFLIVNPYDNDLYKELITAPEDQGGFEGEVRTGYIRFNLSDPDVVYVYPQVGSGAWIDLFGDAELVELYPFNLEGLYVVSGGYSTEEVYEVMDMNFLIPSYYDADDNTVYLMNNVFGVTGSMLSTYQWVDENKQAIEVTGEVVFNFDAGVDGILDDAANAPVKYYNLQGVEISNPSKGQIVIKKQGNKSTKVIRTF